MDLEDHGIGLAHIFQGFFIKAFELLHRLVFCILESLPLCIHIIDVLSLDHFVISLIEQDLADRYTAEYTFTANRNHNRSNLLT